MTDVWRLLTLCPVCLAWVHLSSDLHGGGNRPGRGHGYGKGRQQTWRGPKARVTPHFDSIGSPCIMSFREAPPWDEQTTRPAVHGRSQGVCEFCRRHRATDMHHRISRGVGGKWHPANIIHICRDCHLRATNPKTSDPSDWAYANGLCLRSTDGDPSLHAVLTPFGALWLSDEITRGPEPRTRRGTGKRRK